MNNNNYSTFYIESHRFTSQHGRKYWRCQVKENGQLVKEWINGRISQYYQANIYAVLRLVIELEPNSTLTVYLPNKLIVREAQEFKKRSLNQLRKDSCLYRTGGQTRWYYLALAYLNAQEKNIDLIILNQE